MGQKPATSPTLCGISPRKKYHWNGYMEDQRVACQILPVLLSIPTVAKWCILNYACFLMSFRS